MVKFWNKIKKEKPENPADHVLHTKVMAGLVLLPTVLVLMTIHCAIRYFNGDKEGKWKKIEGALIFLTTIINIAIDVMVAKGINDEMTNL